MTQRVTLALSAALAAFIIVVMGALGAYLLRGAVNQPAFASQSRTSAQAPSFPQQFQDSGSGSGYAVSADDAAHIALSSVPGSTLLQQPRLVNLNGVVAYEVALNQGYIYVDANSGQVIYNGANGTQSRPRHRR